MEEQFVPFELSMKLNILGFDEKVMALYEEVDNKIKLLYYDNITITYLLNTAKHEGRVYHCKAPLWQQVFIWLNTEHNIKLSVSNEITFSEKVEKLSEILDSININ